MAKKIRTLKDLKVANKIVIVRANLDVPIENNEITDQLVIKSASETIKYLVQQNSKVIVLGHLGKPNGNYADDLSLMPVRFALGNFLGMPIKFADIKHSENSIKFMEFGEVLMLENLKFYPESESEKEEERQEFIKTLAKLADFYVYDDFATNRKLASTYELPKLKKSAIGLNVLNEISKMENFKNFKSENYTVIFGGKFKELKAKFLLNNASNINNVLIGGEFAYDFLSAQGFEVKGYEKSKSREVLIKKVIKELKANKVNLLLPVDHVTSESGKVEEISKSIKKGSDIGPETIKLFNEVIEKSDKILIHGPMGEYLVNGFDKGTKEILETIVFNTPDKAMTYACGKAMLKVINKFKIKTKRFSHISTSGDLMLNFLGEEKNPNLEILQSK